jgi:hypothetical protein
MAANPGQIFTNKHGVKTIVAHAPDGHLRVYDLAKYLAMTAKKTPHPAGKTVVAGAAAAVGLAALSVYVYRKITRSPS